MVPPLELALTFFGLWDTASGCWGQPPKNSPRTPVSVYLIPNRFPYSFGRLREKVERRRLFARYGLSCCNLDEFADVFRINLVRELQQGSIRRRRG